MKVSLKNYFINLFVPAFIFGSITGIMTAIVISLYQLCAGYIITLSERGYQQVREHMWLLAIVIPILLLLALCFAWVYRNHPNLRGGGIPTTIGVLRGILPIHGIKNLVGVFTMSLSTFLIGVPLGNEGPSVQMGTAIGKSCVRCFTKRHWAWERYSMTGGACAGFSVATGAPISGILFSVEEAHQRISPMLLIVSATSVMFAELTAKLLAAFLPIHNTLFPKLQLIPLSVREAWIPLVVGVVIGLFAVLFLKYYHLIKRLMKRVTTRMSAVCTIFLVFVLTVALGLCSYSFISTGHDLMISLLDGSAAIWFLLLVLLVRSTLTLCANSANITGGMFVPILALGALLSAILGKAIVSFWGLGPDYQLVILVLGITACIAGMMKMPLTAIIFSVEALSCYENILYVIVVATVAFIITEFFGAQSINDSVIEHRVESLHEGKTAKVMDVFVTVQPDSFAIGKQIRDILWPYNLFVLSLKHTQDGQAEMDEHGEKEIRQGDILHVRYSTYDDARTIEELLAIVGEQEICEREAEQI